MSKSRRLAAIDIGTNTVLLLIADVTEGKLTPVHFEQRIPRLGKGVDVHRVLHNDSIRRVIDVLLEYKHILSAYGNIPTRVTATSAVRDAANRDAFMQQVLAETGFIIQLLSGEEEAKTSWTGALAVLDPAQRPQKAAIIDIGGGSTEFVRGTIAGPETAISFDMGAVRFTERYFLNGYSAESLTEARNTILSMLGKLPPDHFAGVTFIGVAGTVTSLASMIHGQQQFNPEPLNGMEISRETIRQWLEKTMTMSTEALIAAFPAVMTGRADIFPSGLLILHTAMTYFNVDALMVSCGGIREGAVLLQYLSEV